MTYAIDVLSCAIPADTKPTPGGHDPLVMSEIAELSPIPAYRSSNRSSPKFCTLPCQFLAADKSTRNMSL